MLLIYSHESFFVSGHVWHGQKRTIQNKERDKKGDLRINILTPECKLSYLINIGLSSAFNLSEISGYYEDISVQDGSTIAQGPQAVLARYHQIQCWIGNVTYTCETCTINKDGQLTIEPIRKWLTKKKREINEKSKNAKSGKIGWKNCTFRGIWHCFVSPLTY